MWWPGAVGAAQTVTDLLNRPMRQAYVVPKPGDPFDPAIFRLGAPCKRNHLWDEGVTLRMVKGGKCPLCERIDALDRQRKRRAEDREGCNAQAAAYKRQARADGRMPSRSAHGLPYRFLEDNGFKNGQSRSVSRLLQKGLTVEQIHQQLTLEAALRKAGTSPSVARLIYREQQKRWRAHPAEYRHHLREKAKREHQWRYLTDLAFRLYHRGKSKKRKAQQRGSTNVMLSPEQLWRRWVDFDHTCAYCGASGDLQIEHVVPISKGGEHHLGNIVPACQSCNFSKGKADALTWYQSQPFFSETRWQRIQDLLTRSQPGYDQPSLL